MKEAWKEVCLGDVCEISSSKRIYASDYVEKGIPFYRSKEIIEAFNGKKISLALFIDVNKYKKIKDKYGVPEVNDILLTSVGTIGIPFIVKNTKPFYFKDGNLIWLKTSKSLASVEPKFLYSFITSDFGKGKLDSVLIGSSQKALTISGLNNLKINLPPLPTQQKIANILSAYDDSIENNIKRIELLEEQAQLIYEEWFMRMKFPNYENTPIDEESGLPKGWGEEKIENLVEVTSSKRIFLSDYVEEGIPFFRGKEIILKSKNQSLNDRLYITHEKFNTIRKKFGVPTTGDVLITAVGTLGYPYLVTEDDGDFYFKDGNLIWLKNDNKVLSSYLISCFKNENFKVRLNNIAIGSSQKALTIKSLKALEILLPNESLLESFNEIIQPRYELISRLQVQNQLLKEARDILLPRLMMGVIEV